jgi:hypothetical protein
LLRRIRCDAAGITDEVRRAWTGDAAVAGA